MQKQKLARAKKLNRQAQQAIRQDDFSAAEAHFNAILKLIPRHAETLNNLAYCLIRQQKSPDKIEKLLKSAVSLKKDYEQAYINLILFYKETEQPVNALKAYRTFSRHCQLDRQLRLDQARILQEIGQFWESYEILQALVAEYPDYMEGHFYYANVALRLGDNETAITHFQTVLDHEFNVVALNNLAMCYLSTRRRETAETMLRDSISRVPQYAEAYRNLSMMKKFKSPDDPDIALFESSLGELEIIEPQKVHLYFALGKAYDDCGEYEKAFHYYSLGNRTQRGFYDYSIDDPVEKFESLTTVFRTEAGCVPVAEPFNDGQPVPVFIVGMPRSGTSLLEQILSSVEDVNALGELTLVENQMIEKSIASDFLYPRDFHQLSRSDFRSFRETIYGYIHRIEAFQPDSVQPGSKYIIDKQPFNFWHVGLILQIFPEAKIIHSMRNPLDTCLSNYFQYFHGNLGYVYDLKEIGQYYRLQQQMMDFWKDCYPDSIVAVDYQQLVDEPQANLMAMFDFLDIEWSEQYLKFYESKRPVRTLSVEQVRSPIYSGSVERWKNYEPWIGELIEMFAPPSGGFSK